VLSDRAIATGGGGTLRAEQPAQREATMHERPSKSRDGLPGPTFAGSVDFALEARKSRERLVPTTVAYVAGGIVLIAPTLNRHTPLWAAVLAGLLAFTGVEYFVHRFLLHGRFPDGPGALRRFLHSRLDHLHYVHHSRPWDGAHMHGSLVDTLPLTLPLAIAALLAPPPAPAFVGALLLAYVAEEWTHHALHYGRSQSELFVRLQRRHRIHHSPRGSDRIFGLTSGAWDAACGTSLRWARRPSQRA
jgi:cyclopropane-fatty-acyl-phospholipid synthase